MKVIVFGRQSTLASYLLKINVDGFHDVFRANTDVASPELFARGHDVDVVVNCAGVTENYYAQLGYGRHGWAGIYEEVPAMRGGRSDTLQKTASRLYVVNGIGAGNVALYAKAHGAYLIHVSCASVMGADGPYYGTQRPYPQDMLGYTKRAGELNVEAVMGSAPYTIIRFGALYGARYQGCPPLVAEGRKGAVIDDMTKVMPIHGEEAAHKINVLINSWQERVPELGVRQVGPSNSIPLTWYEFLNRSYPHIEPSREQGRGIRAVYGLVPSNRDFTAGYGMMHFVGEMAKSPIWATRTQ